MTTTMLIPATKGDQPGWWDGERFTPCLPFEAFVRCCAEMLRLLDCWSYYEVVGVGTIG